MEQLDQTAGTGSATDFPRFVAHLTEETSARFEPDLLNGVIVLEHPGELIPATSAQLYQADSPKHAPGAPVTLRMIPYYAWSNRQLSAMQVWIPYREV
jgi:DUF1680 family protein